MRLCRRYVCPHDLTDDDDDDDEDVGIFSPTFRSHDGNDVGYACKYYSHVLTFSSRYSPLRDMRPDSTSQCLRARLACNDDGNHDRLHLVKRYNEKIY